MRDTRTKLEKLYADATGKTPEEVHEACERDNFLPADKALEFGLCDEVLVPGQGSK